MRNPPAQKKLTVDLHRYDPLQRFLLAEIARDIKTELRKTKLDEGKIQGLTENLTFGIAAIVDGSRRLELDGAQVRPILAFGANEDGTELLGAAGGSWMHEYAIGLVEQMFEEEVIAPLKIQNWTLHMEFPDGTITAYAIRVNIARPDIEILDELRADCAKWKKTKLSLTKVAAAYLVAPDGKKKYFDLRKQLRTGLTPNGLLRMFRAAAKSEPKC